MQPSWLMHDAKFGFYLLWSFWWVGRQVRKLRHRIAQMLFQAQNCASYIKKNQLQKKKSIFKKLRARTRDSSIFIFLSNLLLHETTVKKDETATEWHIKNAFSLFSKVDCIWQRKVDEKNEYTNPTVSAYFNCLELLL